MWLLCEHGEVDGRPTGVVAHVQQSGVRTHVQQGEYGLSHAVEDGDVQLAVDKQKKTKLIITKVNTYFVTFIQWS